MEGWELFFALVGVALAVIPWTMDLLGMKIPRKVAWVIFVTGTFA
jgi:hypothetical protein